MAPQSITRPRGIFLAVVSVVFVIVLVYSHFWTRESLLSDFPRYRYRPQPKLPSEPPIETKIALPTEYASLRAQGQSDFCNDRFGTKLLEDLRDRSIQYCTNNSISNLRCFHTDSTGNDERPASLCIIQKGRFDTDKRGFVFDCPLRDISDQEVQDGAVRFLDLRSYWYDTGPKTVFSRHVDLNGGAPGLQELAAQEFEEPFNATQDEGEVPEKKRNFMVLIKREGEGNLWHCLMEIMTMSYSFDVLRLTRDPSSPSGEPYFALEDVPNTQVVVADDKSDGPYYDLWRLFSGRPVLRLSDLTSEKGRDWSSKALDNLIVPLSGITNGMWMSQWETVNCPDNTLLRTFVSRVLGFYNIPEQQNDREHLVPVVTFVDRRHRKLRNQDSLIEALKKKFPDVIVQVVDFEGKSFADQIRTVRDTNVLVGVHGAGLTHMLFLPQKQSAVAEIQPPDMWHRGFRNIAPHVGVDYFVAHATRTANSHGKRKRHEWTKRGDWHDEDVFIEEERFLELVGVAIKSVFNKGSFSKNVA